MSTVQIVNDQSNVAEAEQAIRVNAALSQQAVTEQIAAESQITKQEGQAAAAPEGGSEAGATHLDSASSGAGEGKALSTEGGLAADVAVHAMGGGGIEIAKTLVDGVRDMDPGKFKGMNTMENFAAPKAGRSIQGSFMSDIFARANIAGESVNGEDRIKGAQANEQSVSALKNTQQLKMVANLDAQKHLGHAHAHKAQLGGQEYQARQAGLAPGSAMGGGTANINRSPHLSLNEMKPKGPTTDMLEETGTA